MIANNPSEFLLTMALQLQCEMVETSEVPEQFIRSLLSLIDASAANRKECVTIQTILVSSATL